MCFVCVAALRNAKSEFEVFVVYLKRGDYLWYSDMVESIKIICNAGKWMADRGWLPRGGTISLMKQQFDVTHNIRQTEILTLLDSWVTNTFSQNLVSTKRKLLLLIFS
jgi:hypothetical protein